MKAYFSRIKPFYLLAAEEMSDQDGFDAYPVEIDGSTLEQIRAVRVLIQKMEETFNNNPAPEECAQEEADLFVAAVKEIFNG